MASPASSLQLLLLLRPPHLLLQARLVLLPRHRLLLANRIRRPKALSADCVQISAVPAHCSTAVLLILDIEQ